MTRTISDKRLSQLADMCVQHIIWGRYRKAMLIAQFLRAVTGFHLVNMNAQGHVKPYNL